MLEITVKELADACGITDYSNLDLDKIIKNVTIDSRKACSSCLFVALPGSSVDGHQFVGKVVTSGGVAIVRRGFAEDLPNLLIVDNPERSLGQIANYWRHKSQAKIVGVTGSNGKTTVKEMLYSVCIQHYGGEYVSATSGNLNNQLGVPLTLLTMSLQDKVAIIEMGMNHRNEIEYLTSIANPDIVAINNVMLAHVGNFTSVNEIAEAKGEIYTNLAPHGVALVNKTDPYAHIWDSQLAELTQTRPDINVEHYGVRGSYCYLVSYDIPTKLLTFFLHSQEYQVTLSVPGVHNAKNAITVISIASQLGVPVQDICIGLSNYMGYKGRLEVKHGNNNWTIIDDTYNANLDSVKAALDVLVSYPSPKWFIFADLKEMGDFSVDIHRSVGVYATDKVDGLITYGYDSRNTNDVFIGDKIHCDTIDTIVEYCTNKIPPGAVILVKGSQAMNMEALVHRLLAS